MRKKIIAGNWKMNLNYTSGTALVRALLGQLQDIEKCDVVFCPPFPLLAPVAALLDGTCFALGAQNLFWEDKGAYTGEVSADMLLSFGCRYVIVGHSERRKYFHETDETVNRRIKKALQTGLIPIMCIGETLEERQTDQTESVIRRQLQRGLQGLSQEEIAGMILAYEPVWAIGTGKNATPEQAVAVHQYIRRLLRQWYDDSLAQTVRIQYGGSVNDANADELLRQPEIDGALVGGASLRREQFAQIVRCGELHS